MLICFLMKNTIKINRRPFFVILSFILIGATAIYSQDNSSAIKFSMPAGYYDSTITVSISSLVPGASIHITSDGSTPVLSSFKYTSPFRITKTTVVRARLYSGGIPVSKTATCTYFINENISIPVFSISTDPGNFFDPDTGIYEMGPNPGTENPYFNANFWKDWERPIHIEYFESDGRQVINMDAGVKIFGAWSRALPQKSLAVYARNKYGSGKLKYKFFEEREVNEFETIVLRNSGNDWGSTSMRDAVMQGLLSGVDIETQAYRPVVVFINGKYWGIHDLREKINEHFIASYHDVHPDSIDMLESDAYVISGTNTHYKSLLSFITLKDLSIAQNYEYVKMRMDIDNFITYEIAQIYFDNGDWPGNNIKFWRPQRNDGKWRWILYDTDFGFGLFNDHAYQNNTLKFASEPNGPRDWPNPPWSTFLLRRLLTNQDFKNQFISRFSELSNTIFKAPAVVERIRRYRAALEPEMPRHLQRWGLGEFENWVSNVNELETFANNRIQYMRVHFANTFNLTESRLLNIKIDNIQSGSINFNTVNVTRFPWSGSFYKGIPLKITAVPSPGYIFEGWKGIEGVKSNSFTFSFPIHLSITPVFAPDTAAKPDIVINEINYNSSAAFDCEDWIELYNNSGSEIDLSGWILKDENDGNAFILPSGSTLEADGYLVLCSDTAKFSMLFPGIQKRTGDLGFSISNGGELVRLFDPDLRLIDSVRFSDKTPWPAEPDGTGPTLSLKNPLLDNYSAENWAASKAHGTPGAKNDVFSSVAYDNQDAYNDFYIEQNYPNPFNSTTQIKYVTVYPGNFQFRVFDVLGRQVYFQDEGLLRPGIYRIMFSADDLPSGIYYYQVTRNNRSITKMMMLLR